MTVFLGFIFTLLGYPLTIRKVKMNHYYGVRIPKAFESDENWYRINAYGGKLLMAWGISLMVLAAVIFIAPLPDISTTILAFFACALTILIPITLIFLYARKL